MVKKQGNRYNSTKNKRKQRARKIGMIAATTTLAVGSLTPTTRAFADMDLKPEGPAVEQVVEQAPVEAPEVETVESATKKAEIMPTALYRGTWEGSGDSVLDYEFDSSTRTVYIDGGFLDNYQTGGHIQYVWFS